MKQLHFINNLPLKCENKIFDLLYGSNYEGYISFHDYKELLHLSNMSDSAFLLELLEVSKKFALPVISKFYVGAIAKTANGNLYFGANQEFLGTSLNFTLHAEQSSISNAFIHNEKKIHEIIVNYTPCCLCRQFMTELDNFENIKIIMPLTTLTLGELIPLPFGPADLKINDRLMNNSSNNNLDAPDYILKDTLATSAFDAANKSYAPYSKSYSGVSLITKNGRIIQGRYIENAAYNISMNPMSAALSLSNLSGFAYSDIAKAIIVEPKNNLISQVIPASDLLKQINSNIKLQIIKF